MLSVSGILSALKVLHIKKGFCTLPELTTGYSNGDYDSLLFVLIILGVSFIITTE